MSLAVVGYGLVSPGGLTPRDHAFFAHAGVLTPPPSPFVATGGREGPDERRMDVRYCPWIGAATPVRDRLAALACAAAEEAVAPLADLGAPALVLITGRPRRGLDAADVAAVRGALAQRLRPSAVTEVAGEAAAFSALQELHGRLKPDSGPAILVAVDSFVSVPAVEEHARHPPSYWALEALPPSEAAAALAVVAPGAARRARCEVIGTLEGAAAAMGAASDDNDEIVDGAAMTAVLRALPKGARIGYVFGQDRVDSLRKYEWHAASARNAALFDQDFAMWTLESRVGRLGAAAGLGLVTFGLAMLRHAAVLREGEKSSRRACAWAISPDGARGAALFAGGEA